jgi:predicted ATPase
VDHPVPVEKLAIRNFGCIRDVRLELTRLHALIGPNDSGKSTILRAIQKSRPEKIGDRALLQVVSGAWVAGEGGDVDLDAVFDTGVLQTLAERGDVPILRLDPDALRQACRLMPSTREQWFINDRGEGLAGLYDALLSRDRRGFSKLENDFRQLFPTVDSLRLDTLDDATKGLGVTLVDGTEVAAAEMSEGMLYWLAFAILSSLSSRSVLLIEEPENGLHPSRIGEVVRILRKISERTQVIMATHSPLVINELQPEEVTIVTRTPERGTICTPMTQTKNFEERARVYALGELWLSYADGNVEEELVGESSEAKE